MIINRFEKAQDDLGLFNVTQGSILFKRVETLFYTVKINFSVSFFVFEMSKIYYLTGTFLCFLRNSKQLCTLYLNFQICTHMFMIKAQNIIV